jgi:hypothetical protein
VLFAVVLVVRVAGSTDWAWSLCNVYSMFKFAVGRIEQVELCIRKKEYCREKKKRKRRQEWTEGRRLLIALLSSAAAVPASLRALVAYTVYMMPYEFCQAKGSHKAMKKLVRGNDSGVVNDVK